MATYEDIKKANESIITTDIKGNQYAEVSQRIKAFRSVYPEGFIKTYLKSVKEGVVIFEAHVGYYVTKNDDSITDAKILGIGHAYEKEDSSYINKTSYIENCETSAVGRALGMAGFGIDTSVASAEEVANAINNQEKKATPKQLEILREKYTGANLTKLLDANKISRLEDLPLKKASEIITKLGGK